MRFRLSEQDKEQARGRLLRLSYRYHGAARDIAKEIGVSRSFLSAVINGVKHPSQRILDYLERQGE